MKFYRKWNQRYELAALRQMHKRGMRAGILEGMASMTMTHDRVRGSGYMPSLDGWRAIAVLGVMMAHDRPWKLFGHSSVHYKIYGGSGVSIFFAISGFLITSRILEEELLCGRFDIRRFYIRRLLRIQPAALAFLAAVAVLMVVGVANRFGTLETRSSWVAALFLFTNFVYHPGEPSTLTGHFWTLAVEEHFYILLSLTLLLVKRWREAALGGLTVLFGLLAHSWAASSSIPRATQWQLMPLFLAALGAVLLRRTDVMRFAVRVMRPWVVFLATFLIMLAKANFVRMRAHEGMVGFAVFDSQLDFAAVHLAIFWVIATVYHPRSVTTRVLETPVLRFIGKISYSLYLWHILANYGWNFLGSTGGGPIGRIGNHWLRTLAERPSRYATAFLVAYLCYRFVEKPMIRMGHRLAPPATPGRPEFAELPLEMAEPSFVAD